FFRKVAARRRHGPDCQLGGGGATAMAAGSTAHRDVVLLGGCHIDRCVAPAGGHQQSQFGQELEEGTRHWHSFSHDADNVEVSERAGSALNVVKPLIKHCEPVGFL